MKRTLLIPTLLLLAAAAIAQTAPAQTKNPVSSALRDILPSRQKHTIAAVEARPADRFNYKPTIYQMTCGHRCSHMVCTSNGRCSEGTACPAPMAEPVKRDDS